jgi:hypothetical protein
MLARSVPEAGGHDKRRNTPIRPKRDIAPDDNLAVAGAFARLSVPT